MGDPDFQVREAAHLQLRSWLDNHNSLEPTYEARSSEATEPDPEIRVRLTTILNEILPVKIVSINQNRLQVHLRNPAGTAEGDVTAVLDFVPLWPAGPRAFTREMGDAGPDPIDPGSVIAPQLVITPLTKTTERIGLQIRVERVFGSGAPATSITRTFMVEIVDEP